RRREEQLESQLAERVAGVAAALRSGLSLSQAIRFAADEGEPPVAGQLQAVVDREALGVPLDESLERWAVEEGGSDVRLVASVLAAGGAAGLRSDPAVSGRIRKIQPEGSARAAGGVAGWIGSRPWARRLARGDQLTVKLAAAGWRLDVDVVIGWKVLAGCAG